MPRPDAQFVANQKYIASLTGKIWIDAQDHIVTRLIGWPSGMNTTSKATSEVTLSLHRPKGLRPFTLR